MKGIYEKLKKSPFLIIIVVILLFFMPQNLAKSPEAVRNAIITAIGVDKEGEEFELTLLCFIPTAGKEFVETYEILTTKAQSLSEAMNEAGLQLGKDAKLFHTETAIFGNSVLQEDLSQVLDYFSREESLSSSCILIGTDKTAKEIVKLLQENDSNPSDKLSELMIYNSNYVYCKETSLESFYSGYYSPVKTSFMAYLTMDTSEDESIVLSNSSSGGQSEGGDSGNKKGIKNDGSVVLFREGKFVEVLPPRILDGSNWVNCHSNKKNIVLDDFSDDEVQNARVIYYLDHKDVVRSVRFENGVPIYTAQLRLHIDRIEIYGEKEAEGKNIQLSNLKPETIEAIGYEVKKEFSDALENMRENKTDLMGIYREFYQKDKQAFKKFLKSLDNEEDFLSYVVFEMYINVIAD